MDNPIAIFDHDAPPGEVKPPAPEKSAVEQRLEALEAETKTLRTRNEELSASERYWSEQARKPAATAPVKEEEEVVDDGITDAKPGDFLDALSESGKDALKKRGFVTRAEMREEIKRVQAETRAEITENSDGADFDRQLGVAYPELMADNERILAWQRSGAKGTPPETGPLFKKAAEHFRELVADAGIDANSKPARALLKTAARLAKAEIDAEKKAKGAGGEAVDEEAEETAGQKRRRRIDAQASDRGRSGADDERDELSSSPQAKKVISNLTKFLITPAERAKGVRAEDVVREVNSRGRSNGR